MGKMSRTKGAVAERDVVKRLKGYGIPAKRISMMEANAVDKGDIEIGEGLTKDIGSVKVAGDVPKFNYDALADCDYLFSRRDGKPWLVTMGFDEFVFLMQFKMIEKKGGE